MSACGTKRTFRPSQSMSASDPNKAGSTQTRPLLEVARKNDLQPLRVKLNHRRQGAQDLFNLKQARAYHSPLGPIPLP